MGRVAQPNSKSAAIVDRNETFMDYPYLAKSAATALSNSGAEGETLDL